MTREEAITRLKSVWADRPAGLLCIALLEYVLKDAGQSKRLSFGLIHQIAAQSHITDESTIAQAIQYLIGHDLRLLEVQYEFIDDDDRVFSIDKDEQIEIDTTGKFYHPVSGEPDPDFDKKVFIYFSPSALARELSQ
jgi:hypothetical protein